MDKYTKARRRQQDLVKQEEEEGNEEGERYWERLGAFCTTRYSSVQYETVNYTVYMKAKQKRTKNNVKLGKCINAWNEIHVYQSMPLSWFPALVFSFLSPCTFQETIASEQQQQQQQQQKSERK
jgi:hypothetical protein